MRTIRRVLAMGARLAKTNYRWSWVPACPGTTTNSSGPPAHLVGRRLRARIDVGAGFPKSVLLVKAHRAHVVLIDVEIEPLRRQPTGLCQQGAGDAAALLVGRDHDLIEIAGVG